MVVPITDVHYIIGIYCYIGWMVQFPITASLFTKLSHIHTILCEDLDSVVGIVTNKHIASAVKRDTKGSLEFSIARALTTEPTTKSEVRVEDLDLMILFIRNVDLVGVRVYGNAYRTFELQRSTAFSANALQ